MRRLVAVSSTAMTFSPRSSICGRSVGRVVAVGLRERQDERERRAGADLADATVRSPPIMRASWRLIARPRPVPPKRRVVDASACWKDSNRRARSFSAMPMPVSATSKRTSVAPPSSRPSHVTSTVTSPSGVNFTALDSRLVSTCASRPRSPRDRARDLVAEEDRQLQALAVRGRGDDVGGRLDDLAQVERALLQLQVAGLDLRDVQDVVDDRQQLLAGGARGRRRTRCCSRSRSVSSSSSVIPITPLSGVRISWLMLARNVDLVRDASSACALPIAASRLAPDPADVEDAPARPGRRASATRPTTPMTSAVVAAASASSACSVGVARAAAVRNASKRAAQVVELRLAVGDLRDAGRPAACRAAAPAAIAAQPVR